MTPTYRGTAMWNAVTSQSLFVQATRLSPAPTKSVIIPTQNLTFLGFKLDSRSMTVAPTDETIHKTVEACKRLQTTTKPQISDVAEVIDLIFSNFPGVQFGHPLKALSISISCNFKQPSLPLSHFANKHLEGHIQL